ncbi:Fur family transcriptional regulator [Pontibacter beigongshangensis]|uniref:Fur family transcriptional regulator n=1 Tax=Pontibacter beigongshangensis TaxID=2574733 RepID=UPI0016503485|nr:transcriptional repressor [Pontibacter beigongshangensis]
MTKQAQELIKAYGLRKTSCRLDILHLFLTNEHALAHADIEQTLNDRYDRVTIYRTLYAFKEKGLLHSINDVSGAIKYALCQEACDQHQHYDNHIHFSCTACGQTFCISEVHIPPMQLPAGYKADKLHFSAEGLCKTCSQATAQN